MRIRTRLFAAACAAALLLPGSATAAAVDTGFEPPAFVTGTVNGQNGWKSLGSAGSGCALYDHAVVDNTGASYSYPSFGAQSLRISNARTSGCFGDQTFSASTADDAGESDAASGGLSGGTRRGTFVAEWSVASAVPGAQQPGLQFVASPDRGDGARMGWIQVADGATGLDVNFYDYQSGVVEPGCTSGSNFVFTSVAAGLDRTVSHTIRIEVEMPDGPANDVLRLYIDGALAHTGTTWEDYFRECEGTPVSRTVDSILFRTAGAAAPGTLGKGFLIDNVSIRTLDATSLSATPVVADLGAGQVYVTEVTATLTSGGAPLAGKTVAFTADSFSCSAVTDASGVASCPVTDIAVGIALTGGYTAAFAGDADYGASSAAAGLLNV